MKAILLEHVETVDYDHVNSTITIIELPPGTLVDVEIVHPSQVPYVTIGTCVQEVTNNQYTTLNPLLKSLFGVDQE